MCNLCNAKLRYEISLFSAMSSFVFASCNQSVFLSTQFLSMKLATVNPQMDFNLEGLLAKDVRDFLKSLVI